MSKARILMLLLLVSIGSWAWWHNQQQADVNQARKEFSAINALDYFVEDFSITTMTSKGKPARTLTASSMKHFRDTGITELEQPMFNIYNQSAANWRAVAEHGELSLDGKNLLLSGDVEIERFATPGVSAMHIATSNLRINADQDYAETDDAVKITSDVGWVQGTGMQAWLREPSHIKFLSQTRAHYEAQ